MSKRFTLLLLLCSSAVPVAGQPGLDRLISAYGKFQAAGTHPNMQLVFNQPEFSPGDTVLYKAYLLDQHNLPVAGRNLFRIRITNFKGQIVTGHIFEVVDGLGFNKFQLPDSLAAGLYLLTVESPWLRNAIPPALYHHELEVVNEREIDRHEIRVFAEGGNLVPDFPNKVVCRGPRNSVIQIENSEGEVVDTCLTDDFGLAHAIVNPQDTRSYFATVPFRSLRAEIPVSPQGNYGLRLRRSSTDNAIRIDLKYVGGRPPDKVVAIITGHGQIRYNTTLGMGENEYVLHIPVETFSAGIHTFFLLDEEGHVLAARNFYHHPLTMPRVEILPLQPAYHSRQEVQFDIALKDEGGDLVAGEFAFWVVNGNVIDPLDVIMRLTGLNIPIPAITQSGHSRTFLESLDDYCIAQGVKPEWETVFRTDWPAPNSHRSVLYKTGTVYINESREPAPDNTQVSFYFLNTGLHYQTFTLNGRVQITMPEFHGDEKLFYMAEGLDGSSAHSVRIEWDMEPGELASSARSFELTEEDEYGQFATKLKSIRQSYRYFSDAREGAVGRANSSVLKLADADVVVNLSEYQSFGTLRELINEIVPSLKFRIRRDKPTVRVDLKAAAVAKEDPLFIIDGFPTQNAALFLTLQPRDIESIGIIRSELKLRKLGLMGKNGIVLVETNNTDLHGRLSESLEMIRGISPVVSYHDPDARVRKDPEYPIFRSTVCWMPSVNTGPQGKTTVTFFTTDDTGPLYIFVVGLTKGGKPVFASKRIEVNAEN